MECGGSLYCADCVPKSSTAGDGVVASSASLAVKLVSGLMDDLYVRCPFGVAATDENATNESGTLGAKWRELEKGCQDVMKASDLAHHELLCHACTPTLLREKEARIRQLVRELELAKNQHECFRKQLEAAKKARLESEKLLASFVAAIEQLSRTVTDLYKNIQKGGLKLQFYSHDQYCYVLQAFQDYAACRRVEPSFLSKQFELFEIASAYVKIDANWRSKLIESALKSSSK